MEEYSGLVLSPQQDSPFALSVPHGTHKNSSPPNGGSPAPGGSMSPIVAVPPLTAQELQNRRGWTTNPSTTRAALVVQARGEYDGSPMLQRMFDRQSYINGQLAASGMPPLSGQEGDAF